MTDKLQRQHLSMANKMARAVWQLVWLVLFRPTPRSMHTWRAWLVRLFGARLGTAVHIYPSARIWAPWNLEMGDHACLSEDVDCYSVARITVGAHATVSQYSFLCSASHDHAWLSMPLVCAPITIGAHAWITADVFVAPGVHIGEGAVVTARSSVFDDIPAWTIARGNPARVVRPRVLKREDGQLLSPAKSPDRSH